MELGPEPLSFPGRGTLPGMGLVASWATQTVPGEPGAWEPGTRRQKTRESLSLAAPLRAFKGRPSPLDLKLIAPRR